MTDSHVLEIFKKAITPKYQQYFEVDEYTSQIRFTPYVKNIFNFGIDMFASKFNILAFIHHDNIIFYNFYFDKQGIIRSKLGEAFRATEITVLNIQAIMDKTIEFIKQVIPIYKEYMRNLTIEQLEEI